MHCIVDADLLSINNIKEVLDEVWDYRARWKFIGIQLHIDTGTLDTIEKDCKMVDDCLLMMIKGWLRNTNPRPTRKIIRVALQSKYVLNRAGNYASKLSLYYRLKVMILPSLHGIMHAYA